MFASSQCTSALVIVITLFFFCCSHLCLGQQDIDPNSSILEATRIENGPSQFHREHLDSVEKSDHNFYLPISKSNKSTLLSANDEESSALPSAKLTKKPPTCSSYLQALVTTPKRQCSYVKPSLFHKNLTAKVVPNLNLTENCERPDISSIIRNETKTEVITPEPDTLDITTSQKNVTNETKPVSLSPIDGIFKPTDTKDMLSFEEWRKKISENDIAPVPKQPDLNVQDHPTENNVQPVTSTLKLSTNRARNFASHECAAKIVDSNVDADFVNRVLNEQTDEYMLNPCKTKNWFVIELCETIQPQYLELANFELYSSIPKEFTVYASEHYPARNDWSVLGTFTSNDVRTIQGFKLQKNGFVKYLKIELHSYYGSEHFCPISVIRVFGTSLFDEVERIDKPDPIDYINRDENSIFEESLQEPNAGQDIFGNAKKAVYNIFKAINFNINIFNKKHENFTQNKEANSSFNVTEQSQAIKLFSSFEKFLAQCESFFINNNQSTMNIPSKCIFLQFSFPDQLFDLLYSQYFIRKFINKNLLFQSFNTTYYEFNPAGISLMLTNSMHALYTQLNHRNANKLSLSNFSYKLSENYSHKSMFEHINTSLTSSIDPSLSQKLPSLNLTLDSSLIQPTLVAPTVINTQHTLPLQSTMTMSSVDNGHQSYSPQKNNTPTIVQLETKTEQVQLPTMPSLAPDYESEALSSASGQSKEAVIIRLTSRIKNLEKNISLMSTYLENLSVRYRIQMEEMQLMFNKTIDHLNNTAIRAAEKDAKQQEFIMALESEINLMKAKMASSQEANEENWLFLKIHICLMLFGIVLSLCICLIFYFIFRNIASSCRKNIPTNHNIQKTESESNLLTQSSTQIKKSLYRSKSLSDLHEQTKKDLINESPIESFSLETQLGDTDCDNSDKENCDQVLSPSRFNNSNSLVPSNLGDLTIDPSAKKILKAVNN